VFYIEEEVCSQQADTLSNHMFRNFEYIDSTSCLAAYTNSSGICGEQTAHKKDTALHTSKLTETSNHFIVRVR